MKDLPIGQANTRIFVPEERHTASADGNHGVHVIGTPSLILFLEHAAHDLILPCCDAGEATVGVRVEVDHLKAAFLGQPIEATARLTGIEKRTHLL